MGNAPADCTVEELLDRWEELREVGEQVTPEELAGQDATLLGELKRWITALEAMRWLDHAECGGDEEESSTLPGELGGYELVRYLGEGGFGEVWEAFDSANDCPVAIKICKNSCVSTLDQLAALAEEKHKVDRLQHSQVAAIRETGQDQGYCFIVFDLIAGEDLSRRSTREKFAPPAAMQLVAEVADILEDAHRHGLIHRDIKPSNILLDQVGRPFVTDFGIAVTKEELALHQVATMGTLPYMSPERLAGHTELLDARTDIYSLGVVLYQLLAGRLPFTADDPADLRDQILSQEPPPIEQQSEYGAELGFICAKAMAKSPDERFCTAAEFATALREVVRGD